MDGDEQVLLVEGIKRSGEREAASGAGVVGGAGGEGGDGLPHSALGAPLLVMSNSGVSI